MSRIKKNHFNLVQIGKIKVGDKTVSSSGKEIPCSLDYFRATGHYSEMFSQKYGKEPRALTIGFFSERADDNCIERYEIRQGPKLYAFSQYDDFYVWEEKEQAYIPQTVEPEKMDMFMSMIQGRAGEKSEWQEVLYLNFYLPEIPIIGYWQFVTRGKASSIKHIVSSYDMAEKIVRAAGRSVKGIKFRLSVEKVTSNKPGSKSKFPVVSLVPEDEVFALMLKKTLRIEQGPTLPGADDKKKLPEVTG